MKYKRAYALWWERVDSTHFSLCYAAKTAPSCCRSSRTYKHATGMFAIRRSLKVRVPGRKKESQPRMRLAFFWRARRDSNPRPSGS